MSRRADILRLKNRLNDKLEKRKPRRIQFRALIGDHEGNIFPDTSNTREIYVRREGRAVIDGILNIRCSNVYGMPVLVGYSDEIPHRLQVLSIDGETLGWALGDIGLTEDHHQQHEFRKDGTGGSDVVWIDKQQIINGLVYPPSTAGLQVNVHRFWYDAGNSTHFMEQQVDILNAELTAAEASLGAGQSMWVGIYLDITVDPHAFDTVNSTAFVTVFTPAESEDSFPTWPSGIIRLAAVYLTKDDTTVTWSMLYDMRSFPTGGAGVLSATSHELLDGDVHPDTADADPTQGDIIVADATPEWNRLAVGANHEFIKSDGTDPSWSAILNADLPDPLAFKSAATTLTISGGSVTATQNLHIIAAETGTEDDLDTINGLTDRQWLLLKADTGDTITVKHGTGNIHFDSGEDFELSGDSWLLLFYDGASAVALGAGGGGTDLTGLGTDNTIARWDGTDTLQDSGHTIDDNDTLTFPDDADHPPWNVTERSAAPSSPSEGDLYLDDGTNTATGSPGWRRYNGSAWEDVGATGAGGTDSNAIHDNVASEISAISEKASPVDADLVIIEDSEDSNNKKKAQVGNLPGGSGGYTAGAKVRMSSDQSIPDSTWTTLNWDSEDWDTDTIHDNSTNNERLTCQTAGKYIVVFRGRLDGSSDMNIQIDLNGTLEDIQHQRESSGWPGEGMTTLLDLSVSDYITVKVRQTSGGALNLEKEYAYFSMQRIG